MVMLPRNEDPSKAPLPWKRVVVAGLVAKLCLTLWDPTDCSPPGSSFHGISRQEYWSGLPFPSPGDLPDPGIKPASPALAGRSFTAEPPGSP